MSLTGDRLIELDKYHLDPIEEASIRLDFLTWLLVVAPKTPLDQALRMAKRAAGEDAT